MAETGAQKSNGWVAPLAAVLALGGLVGLGYVITQALSKPESVEVAQEAAAPVGYARFAQGSLAKLAVIADPPAMPDLAIYDAEGAPTTLAALPGKVKLVNVWATWCVPCLTELPTLGALQQEYADRGLTVAALQVEPVEKAQQGMKMLADLGGGALAFYLEPSLELPSRTAIPGAALGLPLTILYDAQGRELARLAGGANWASPEAKALIDAALAQAGA